MNRLRLSGRVARVRERIATACERHGRRPDDVRLVAVSKQVPLDLVVEAFASGVRDFGENRVFEALARQDELPGKLRESGLDPSKVRWHFIGHLQRNKAMRAGGRFFLLHGVDSAELAAQLARRAAADGRRESILLEVNLSHEAQKHGVDFAALPALVDRVAGLPELALEGFMGMARYGAEPDEARRCFAALRELAERERGRTGMALPALSMGMSGDFEAAIAEGATIVRIGGAIFEPFES